MQLVWKKLPHAAAIIVAAIVIAAVAGCARRSASGVTLLNASYSPTREL